jgi:hypothetical protein
VPGGRDEHVLRFQIAVNDAFFVSRCECRGDGGGDVNRPARRHRARLKPVAKRFPVEQFRHRIREAVLDPERVDGENVGVGHRRQQTGFALETHQPFGIRPTQIREDLDGDVATEPRIVRAVHFAHPARAKDADDFIGAEARTDAQPHPVAEL